ncbi:hypothetical protein D9M70_590750 [compost metagenome]
MLDLCRRQHLIHLVVQLIRGDSQHITQCRAKNPEGRREHAQGQQDQDQRIDINRPLGVTLGFEQQRGEKAHQQACRQHRVYQPADVVELQQR